MFHLGSDAKDNAACSAEGSTEGSSINHPMPDGNVRFLASAAKMRFDYALVRSTRCCSRVEKVSRSLVE